LVPPAVADRHAVRERAEDLVARDGRQQELLPGRAAELGGGEDRAEHVARMARASSDVRVVRVEET
jgi:ABC-type iron transport system FetAB ATPase subunit